jgi:hypothetical protein
MRTGTQILFLLVVASALFSQQPPQKPRFDWTASEELTGKQTMTKLTLSKSDRAALVRALSQQLKGSHTDESDLVSITRFKSIDLNGDGIPEIVAQASGDICSPTGNCPFWIFQKTAASYKVILKRGAVQTFTIQKIRSDQYLDIVLGMHGSATEQDLRLYRFKDGQYRNAGCYNANWSYIDKNGEEHELKKPRIARCVGYR